jgi:acyl carrier protein
MSKRFGGEMTKSEFLKEIDEIVQADSGATAMADRLDALKGWDSMAVVMFISMVDEKLDMSLDVPMLAACVTVADLAAICGEKVV